MLHTVNKSPFQTQTLESCLAHAKAGHAVLLLEDGVYAALKDTPVTGAVRAAADSVKIYTLGPDLEARGLSAVDVTDGVEVVNYGGFVDLVVEHGTVQSWL